MIVAHFWIPSLYQICKNSRTHNLLSACYRLHNLFRVFAYFSPCFIASRLEDRQSFSIHRKLQLLRDVVFARSCLAHGEDARIGVFLTLVCLETLVLQLRT